MRPVTNSRLVFLMAVALSAAGCRNEKTSDVQPDVPAEQVVVAEGILVEEPSDPVPPPPPASDLVIPGADQAHLKEIEAIERKNTVSIEEIQATFYFGFDKAALGTIEKQDLKALSSEFKKRPGTIVIDGHADERGSGHYNKALGLRRAKAVAGYLEQLGIDKSRIKLNSYGSDKPAISGYNKETWAKNRRAELVFISEG